MKPRFPVSTSLRSLTAITVGLCLAQWASAAFINWDGDADTSFATTANWSGDVVPTNAATPDVAVFGAFGPAGVNLPKLTASRAIAGLSFSTPAGGWTLSGVIQSPTASPQELNVGASGIVSSNTSGTNTITADLNTTTNQTWSVANGGTLSVRDVDQTGGTLTIGSSGNTGRVEFGGSSDNGSMSPVVAFGTLILNKGVNTTSEIDYGSSANNITVNAGATIQYGGNRTSRGGTVFTGQIFNTATLNGTMDLNGYGTLGDNWQIQGLVGSGKVTNNGSGTTQLRIRNGGNNVAFSGVIQDGTAVTQLRIESTNTGATNPDLILTGASTFSGDTTFQNASWLRLGNGNALQNSTLVIPNTSTAKLTFNTGIGTYTVGNLSGGGGSHSIALTDGTAAVTLQAGKNNSSQTYAGNLSGAGNLTKIGSGTLTLNGTNTFTGNTTVTTGSLALGASGSLASPSIQVAAGALLDVTAKAFTLATSQTLSGSGTISGSVATAGSAARIYPGGNGTAGNLTFSNNLDLTPGGTLGMDVSPSAASGNDHLTINGDLALSSNILHLTSLAGAANLDAADYQLISATGNITGSFASVIFEGTPPANAANFTIVTDAANHQVLLHYSASISLFVAASVTSDLGGDAVALRGENVTVTAAVTQGGYPLTGVSVDLSQIGGATSQSMNNLGDGVHYSYSMPVTTGTLAGSKNLTVTVTDSGSSPVNSIAVLTVTSSSTLWDGGGGDDAWATGANWANDLPPGLAGDSLVFGGTIRTTPVIETDYSVTGLTFNATAGNFTLGGPGHLTLAGAGGVVNNSTNPQTLNPGLTLAQAQTINAAAGDIVIAGPIDGGSGATLTKTGSHTLTLNSAAGNSYTGGSIISAGTVVMGNSAALGSSSGSVTLSAAGTLDLAGFDLAKPFADNTLRGTLVNSGAPVNLSGHARINNAGSFTIGGSGNITLGDLGNGNGNGLVKTGSNTVTLAGAGDNSFLYVSSVTSGTLILAKASSSSVHASGSGVVVNGGTVELGGSGGDQIFDSTFLTVNSGVFDTKGLSETVATLSLGSADGLSAGTLTGGGSLNATGAFAARNGVVSVNLGGSAALTKTTAGTLTLNGSNSYTGNTTVSQGALVLSEIARLRFGIGANNVNSALLGAAGATATLNGTLVLDVSAADLTDGNFWTVVDRTNLEVSYGEAFSVLGFTPASHVHTKVDGLKTWTFTEATGVLTLAVAPAQTLVWDGGGANDSWNSADNWDLNLAPQPAGDHLTFAGATRLSPVMDAAYAVDGLNFAASAGSFTISTAGPALTLLGDTSAEVINSSANPQTLALPIVLVKPHTFTTAGAGQFFLTGDISGAASAVSFNANTAAMAVSGIVSGAGRSLAKSGNSSLTLTAANAYDGGTTVNAGTLKMGNSNALGSGEVVIPVGGTLDLNGNNVLATNTLTAASLRGTLTNSGAAVDLSATPITAVGGTFTIDGSGQITLGKIDSARIVKNGVNTLVMAAGDTDNYDGEMVVNSGTVVMAKNGAATRVIGGSNGLTLNGGKVILGGLGGDQIYDLVGITLNAGTFDMGGVNETVSSLNGAAGAVVTNDGSATSTLTLTSGGSFAGSIRDGINRLNLVQTGGNLTLTGANTYTGNTTVAAGTMSVDRAFFADASTVTIGAAAVLNLAHAATDQVAVLILAGVSQSSGVYGALGSGAPNQTARITGSGKIQVGITNFATWSAANAGGQAANLDFDQDGMSNGIEYFMGQTGSGFTANPGVVAGKVTWPNGGNIASSAYGTAFVVQTSPDLTTWSNVAVGDSNLNNTAGSVQYTLPSGAGKLFVRLLVTPN